MALLAPVAFAVGGGLLTGGATWGMAAGWLIGSWLFGPKAENDNKIFDPGEEEIPSFNQALRGSTMPILFGTNRISSQVVWTKNWTVIRKESGSGGGGKSGGSGMGGKQGSQQGEVTYEYKWDLMFHIGMSDQNMDLLGGWLISERINDETIGAILAGADSTWATFNGLIQAASEADSVWDGAAIGAQYESGEIGADFDFEDSYYHGAGPTDGTFDNWAHFESEEGGPYRWPYTCYVGFKQFNLGATARVPQITWEVGEGGVNLSYDGASVAEAIEDPGTTYWQGFLNPYGFMVRGKNGILHKWGGGDRFAEPSGIRNSLTPLPQLSGSAVPLIQLISNAQFQDDFNNTHLGPSVLGPDSVQGFNFETIEDRYIIAGKQTNADTFWYVLYEIENDTTLNPVGTAKYEDPGLTTYFQSLNFLGISGEGTDDDYILFQTHLGPGVGGQITGTWWGPSINQLKTSLIDTSGANDIVNGMTFDGNFSDFNTDNSLSQTGPAFAWGYNPNLRSIMDTGWGGSRFALPEATIDILGVSWDDAVYSFISKTVCQWHIDNPGSGSPYIDSQVGTYPNGFVIKRTGVVVTDGPPNVVDEIASGTVTVVNDKFVDTDGNSVFPFDDAQLDEDGNTAEYSDYHWFVTNQRLRSGFGAGGNLVIFWKTPDNSNDENRTFPAFPVKCRVFLYNPVNQVFTQYAKVFGGVMNDITAAPINTSISPAYFGVTGGYWDSKTGRLLAGISANGFYDHIGTLGNLNISGGVDVTPPDIIYRILTSTVYGLGISEDDIDATSYGLANQYCDSEGIRVSAQYRREEGALAIITQLLELYGGFLIDSGGKIKFGLQEFSTSTVRTIDNDHLRIDQEGEPPVLITKGARQDTYNRVKVNYFDRSLDYRQNFIEVSDEVDMDINGVRAQEFPAKFVMSETTARKMAVRALWGNLYARDIYDFKLGAKDADLEPGDVITLVDSYHTELQSGKQARIVTWQETEPLTFQVKAVEEVEYINDSTLAPDDVTEATKNVLNIRPKPMAEFGMYELPDEYQGADAQLFVGYRQQSPIMGARLYVSADGVTYGLAGDTQPYVISGIFLDGLPSRNPGYVEENVEVYLIPDTTVSGGFNTTTPYFAQKHTLDDVNASGRASGLGNIWAGSEMLAFEGVNLVAQNWYRFDKLYRGWGGTHIQDHSSGDTWWKQAAGIFTQGINQDKIGTLIYYKVTGYNFNGVEYNLSSVDARTYQILGTYWRPQVQAPIATYVQSPSSYLTIQSEDLGYIQKKQVVTGGSPVQFEWSQSAREAGYGAAGYGLSGYGRFTQDTTSVSYRVEVLSNDLSTVVRCTTVNTTAYLYTTNLNSEDWTGWNGSFAVRVTPFNPYGTALRSRTKILELFE